MIKKWILYYYILPTIVPFPQSAEQSDQLPTLWSRLQIYKGSRKKSYTFSAPATKMITFFAASPNEHGYTLWRGWHPMHWRHRRRYHIFFTNISDRVKLRRLNKIVIPTLQHYSRNTYYISWYLDYLRIL